MDAVTGMSALVSDAALGFAPGFFSQNRMLRSRTAGRRHYVTAGHKATAGQLPASAGKELQCNRTSKQQLELPLIEKTLKGSLCIWPVIFSTQQNNHF